VTDGRNEILKHLFQMRAKNAIFNYVIFPRDRHSSVFFRLHTKKSVFFRLFRHSYKNSVIFRHFPSFHRKIPSFSVI
jgi:hypothetical protein